MFSRRQNKLWDLLLQAYPCQGLYLPSAARRGWGRFLIVVLDRPVPELFHDRRKRAAKRLAGGGLIRLPKVSAALARWVGQRGIGQGEQRGRQFGSDVGKTRGN